MTGQDLVETGGAAGREAKWQKQVVVALWTVLALVLLVCLGLMYAKTHGLFQMFAPDPAAPWPAEWP